MTGRCRLKIGFVFACIFTVLTLLPPGAALAQQQPLTLGIHPYLPPSELVHRFTPLADYLAKVLKRPVEIEISNSYMTHIQKVGNNMVHIALLGPASYVILTQQFGKKRILAGFASNGKRTFRGAIVTNKDSRIRDLRELKGKRFAFGDPESTMAHLVPRYLLLRHGVGMSDLSTHMFLANHDNIALGVLAGNFDAGAVKEDTFLKYQPEGLRAIAWTPEICDHVFVASSLLTRQTVRKVRRALLDLGRTPEGRRILSGLRGDVTALVPVEDSEFNNLRDILGELRKAGVNP